MEIIVRMMWLFFCDNLNNFNFRRRGSSGSTGSAGAESTPGKQQPGAAQAEAADAPATPVAAAKQQATANTTPAAQPKSNKKQVRLSSLSMLFNGISFISHKGFKWTITTKN